MSKSVVIQGAQVGAIPSLAQGSKTYTPGRGSKKHVQGLVTVRALYDKPTLKRHNETAATRSTVFPKPVTDESLDVVEDEFCFMTKVPRSDVSEDKHSLHIGSSLNGIGADVAEAYPGDAEVQRVATRNRIKYAGIARDTVDYTSGNKRQGLALGIAGESTHFADNDLAPGQLAELIVPLPGKNSTGSYVRKPYVPEGKVTLELAPYAPKNLETRVQAVMRAFTENEDKFRKAMDPKYRTTLMWANVYESWWNHIVTSWAILTKTLQDAQVIQPIQANGGGLYNLPGNGETLIGNIANAFGTTPKLSRQIQKQTKEAFLQLKRDAMFKLFYDGKILQHAIDYNRRTGDADGRDMKTGRVILDNIKGHLLHNQLNHWRMMISAIGDAINNDRDFIIGRVTHGSSAGGKADIMQ